MAINQIAIRNSEGNFENLFPLTIDKGGTGATTLPGVISKLFPTNYGSAGFPSNVFVTCFSDEFNKSGYCTVSQFFNYASKELYPVGTVYISYNSTSPATLFGGSWAAITGRFPYFNAGTGTGGANSHIHSLGGAYAKAGYDLSNSPNIQLGKKATNQWSSSGVLFEWTPNQMGRYKEGTITKSIGVPLGGGTDSSSTMPAYQSLYAWRRTS